MTAPGGTRRPNNAGTIRAKTLVSGNVRYQARLRGQHLGMFDTRAAAQRAVNAASAPQEGICRVCGCTDEWGCDGGCSWVNAEHTLCSECVDGDQPMESEL